MAFVKIMKRFFRATTLSFLLVGASNAYSRGGENSGGGGDVIQCARGPFRGTYLADTFDVFSTGALNIPRLSTEAFEKYFAQFLENRYPSLRGRVSKTLDALVRVPVRDLPELNDDFIGALPKGCQKKQLAIQDMPSKTMRYHLILWRQLSPMERALFMIHETLIQIRHRFGDTSDIRRLIDQNYRLSVTSPMIQAAKKKFREELKKDPMSHSVAVQRAALDTCRDLKIKSCLQATNDFFDSEFSQSCPVQSYCGKNFKRIFEQRLYEIGFDWKIPQPYWEQWFVNNNGRVWQAFAFLALSAYEFER